MMEDKVYLAYTIFSLILILVLSFSVIITEFKLTSVNKLIADCEKSLPRDQYCKLVAVPK